MRRWGCHLPTRPIEPAGSRRQHGLQRHTRHEQGGMPEQHDEERHTDGELRILGEVSPHLAVGSRDLRGTIYPIHRVEAAWDRCARSTEASNGSAPPFVSRVTSRRTVSNGLDLISPRESPPVRGQPPGPCGVLALVTALPKPCEVGVACPDHARRPVTLRLKNILKFCDDLTCFCLRYALFMPL